MQDLLNQVTIKINDKLFLKDPESSKLGRSIITGSVFLIDTIGFEEFTFKKLSQEIGSPESSLYRYFENKHLVLFYLITWYWSMLEYRLVFGTSNIELPKEKLSRAIELVTESIKQNGGFHYMDEIVLNRIVIAESSKLYHTKEVDLENKDGLFTVYKRLVQRVSDIVVAVNPDFKFPHMLISTVIEGAHQQKHFSEHLPSLTDVKKGNNDISTFFKLLVFNTIGKNE